MSRLSWGKSVLENMETFPLRVFVETCSSLWICWATDHCKNLHATCHNRGVVKTVIRNKRRNSCKSHFLDI